MKLRKQILFVLLFILVQGLTFAVTYYGFGYRYGSAQEARFSVLSETILALMVLYYIRRYASWREVGYGEFSWRRSLWMAPLLLPVLIYAAYLLSAIASAKPSGLEILGVAAVALMTLLVGFAEETTFRSILLRSDRSSPYRRRRLPFSGQCGAETTRSLLHGRLDEWGGPYSRRAQEIRCYAVQGSIGLDSQKPV